MKSVSVALTALVATLAIAPYTHAAEVPNAEALQGNLQVETSISEALATTTPDPANVEANHIENLNRVETNLNQLPAEASDRAVVLEVIAIEL